MTAPVEGTPPEAPATPPEPVVETPAPPAEPVEGEKKRRSLEESLAALDEDTRKFVLATVKGARTEAQNLRERAKSADDVRTELASTIAKALGIETEQAPDPAVLAQQLSEQSAKARQSAVELAVYRVASTAGADPNALLDSVSFTRTLADVDPSDSNAITEKVKAAVAANPALAGRRVPGPNPAAGTSGSGAPGIEDEIAAAKKAGDIARVIHLENQKLATAFRR